MKWHWLLIDAIVLGLAVFELASLYRPKKPKTPPNKEMAAPCGTAKFRRKRPRNSKPEGIAAMHNLGGAIR